MWIVSTDRVGKAMQSGKYLCPREDCSGYGGFQKEYKGSILRLDNSYNFSDHFCVNSPLCVLGEGKYGILGMGVRRPNYDVYLVRSSCIFQKTVSY